MKKIDRKKWKQCELEIVERKAPNPIPGVPEHFNHGVFFSDDCDYMRYLKSRDEFGGGVIYRITGLGDAPSPDVNVTDFGDLREPEVDEDKNVPSELGLNSDDEYDCGQFSDIEDNFVELAGGVKIKDVDDETKMEISSAPHDASDLMSSRSVRDVLPRDKVLMMERYLFGDCENDLQQQDDAEEYFDIENSVDQSMMDRDFLKLMLKCRNRSSANQSMISGTSMMSEGLQFALSRDDRLFTHKLQRSEALEPLDEEIRSRTLSYKLGDAASDGSDSDSSEEEVPKEDIMSVQSGQASSQPNYLHLTVPKKVNVGEPTPTLPTPIEACNESAVSSALVVDPEHLLRVKGETADEKRMRKRAIKQHRRDRRQIRKTNRENFRIEHERQLRTAVQLLTIQ